LKKKFLIIGATGCAVIFWLANTLLGGFLYATAAFFTKEGWQTWKEKRTRRP
jgi:hypothetical protein